MIPSDDIVHISWYEHDCDWITKYCDEHHRHSANVSRSALVALIKPPSEEKK